jgi:succinate dehydrogenase / fumarate reductase cytochrome b subunit
MMNSLSLMWRKYRWRYAGHLAFWVQRLTGVALLGYLIVHVHTIRDLKNPETFGDALKTFGSPLFKMGEIALLATVILHALNGVRLTLVDMGVGVTRQRQTFWYFAIGFGLVLFLAGAVPMFIHGVLR